jgi:hypothetical protein
VASPSLAITAHTSASKAKANSNYDTISITSSIKSEKQWANTMKATTVKSAIKPLSRGLKTESRENIIITTSSIQSPSLNKSIDNKASSLSSTSSSLLLTATKSSVNKSIDKIESSNADNRKALVTASKLARDASHVRSSTSSLPTDTNTHKDTVNRPKSIANVNTNKVNHNETIIKNTNTNKTMPPPVSRQRSNSNTSNNSNENTVKVDHSKIASNVVSKLVSVFNRANEKMSREIILTSLSSSKSNSNNTKSTIASYDIDNNMKSSTKQVKPTSNLVKQTTIPSSSTALGASNNNESVISPKREASNPFQLLLKK